MAALAALRAQIDTLLRMLNDAGVEPGQLGRFDLQGAHGEVLGAELALIAREARWHLRAAAHQLRHRWREGDLPDVLLRWLPQIDDAVAPKTAVAPAAPTTA